MGRKCATQFRFATCAIALFATCAIALFATAAVAADPKPMVREIYVPFSDLDVLLENQPQRVLLNRDQYEQLLRAAKKAPSKPVPIAAALVSAEYALVLDDQRAMLSGALVLESLDDGLQAISLDLSGVGLKRAALDGKPAAIARQPDGKLVLLVDGKGRHALTLEMVVAVQSMAARQAIHFRVPQPAATRFRLTAPGDVELKSGAGVADRVVDEVAKLTRFELVPQRGDNALVLTLNSHLAKKQRAVVARSVLVDEVTQGYERLHATLSMGVLHQAVEQFRFAVPEGFEITEVVSPLVARWAVQTEGARKILEVRLREAASNTVVLNISALRTAPLLQAWSLPRLEPLDVVGQVAVVGLLIDERLSAESIQSTGLIPIDTADLRRAIPATVLRAEPGAPALRPVVAYYAAGSEFSLSADFTRPPAELSVTSRLVLSLNDRGQQLQGGFVLTSAVDKLFSLDIATPAPWHVTTVTGPDNQPLPYESYKAADGAGRIRIRLPQGVAPGKDYRIAFTAVAAPAGWVAGWENNKAAFPVFSVLGATRDVGAVAVVAGDDMVVRPENTQRLIPLDEREKNRFGLEGVATQLAFRYESQPFQASLSVQRTKPRVTARSYAFFRVETDLLAAHYELQYRVEEARARELSLVLPADAPTTLDIRGLDGVAIKQFGSRAEGDARRWTILLAEPRRDLVRIAVDFQKPLAGDAAKNVTLPMVRAADVAYQSGLVAIEGSAELEVQVTTKARPVDVGELAAADYPPGRRLLGVFGFVGQPEPIAIQAVRNPAYAMYPSIVQHAELVTKLSAEGVAQTSALYRLQTKQDEVEVQWPAQWQLWSATVDDKPIKPQRESGKLLLTLPAGKPGAPRQLKLVYESPIATVALLGQLDLPAPKLVLHAKHADDPVVEIPIADLKWTLQLPSGYQVVRNQSTLASDDIALEPPALAVSLLAPFWRAQWPAMPTLAMERKMDAKKSDKSAAGTLPDAYYVQDGADTGFGAVKSPERRSAKADSSKAAEPRPDAPKADAPKARPEGEGPFALSQGEALFMQGVPDGKGSAEAAEARTEPAGILAVRSATIVTRLPTAASKPPMPQKRRLQGMASLKTDLIASPDDNVTKLKFVSLGGEPRLRVTLAYRPRFVAMGWTIAVAILVTGVYWTARPARRKAGLILTVVALGTLAPLLPYGEALAWPCNMAVYAAAALVVYYPLTALAARLVRTCRRALAGGKATGAATAAGLLAVVVCMPAAFGQDTAVKPGTYSLQVVDAPSPVKVPDDAILIPYDPSSEAAMATANKILVPYAKYVELWNLAHPDKKLEAKKPPVSFALAGGKYSASLESDEVLVVRGRLEIDLVTDEPALIPLSLQGGVLSQADWDGKPARLSVIQPQSPEPTTQQSAPNAQQPASTTQQPAPNPMPAQAQNASQQPAPNAPGVGPPSAGVLGLGVSGRGRHVLDLVVRMKLERRGGWRVAEGMLPAAPATTLSLAVPQPQTEIRLGNVADRRTYQTEKAADVIETALPSDGVLSVQWRPKVTEGQVDHSLNATSAVMLDVQEDGLHAVWRLDLEFRRSQRDRFSMLVPAEFLVEHVDGNNVRGWEVRKQDKGQLVEVTLLKPARDSESLTLRLWRLGTIGPGGLAEFDAPVVRVVDAALESGRITLRRSPLVDLRTTALVGVSRVDLPAELSATAQANAPVAAPGSEDSPLVLRPYEAYQFAAAPFSLRLTATPIAGNVNAEVRSIVRLAAYERALESRIEYVVQDRPIHKLELLLPVDLRLDQLTVPGDHSWSLTRLDERPLLTVLLASGRTGKLPVLVRGTFIGKSASGESMALAPLEVRGVQRQEGEIAVLVGPAYGLEFTKPSHCEVIELGRVKQWLTPQQGGLAQLALRYRSPDYGGMLALKVREPDLKCETITNVRVTERAVEETILLDYSIEKAGVREVVFLLPAWMKDSRIQVPLLRQKTIEPVGTEADAPIRVRLELQDEAMQSLRVVVNNDRLLTSREHEAPIPSIGGRVSVTRQFVAIESAGRDEVMIQQSDGLDPLEREPAALNALKQKHGLKITRAYVVRDRGTRPRLSFHTRTREAVELAGARIRLAEATLVLDGFGTYAAVQHYRLDNATRQFIEVRLPEGATLWTAHVAGEPVKPTLVPGASDPSRVRIPVVKTAKGDLDYEIRLQYGGRMPAPGVLGKVEFPLMRTVDVDVELSHVRLLLPETHRWFRFDGTMRKVEQEDVSAEKLSYFNKQTERLLDTVRQADKFEKVRAANNLKALISQQPLSTIQRGNAANPNLSREMTANSAVVERARDELGRLQRSEQQVQGDDNRMLLNSFYAEQQTVRSKNVVSQLGRNWDVDAVAKETPEDRSGSQLNPGWVAKNQLQSQVKQPADKEKGDGRTYGYDSREGKSQGFHKGANVSEDFKKLNDASQQKDAQQRGAQPGIAGNPGGDRDRSSGGFQGLQQGRMPAESEETTTLNRYQMQMLQKAPAQNKTNADDITAAGEVVKSLQRSPKPADSSRRHDATWETRFERNSLLMPPATRSESTPSPSDAEPAASENHDSDAGGEAGGGGMGGMGMGRWVGGKEGIGLMDSIPGFVVHGGQTKASQPTVATGLVSLDVKIPERGVEYNFTTPGGDVSVTARAADSNVLHRTGIAAMVLVGLGVVMRLGRRLTRVASPGRNRWMFGILILGVALVVLVLGFVPMAGLLGLGGVWLLLPTTPDGKSAA